MTGADAGDMRIPVLRGLAAAAVVAGLVSGCTGAPSSQPTSPAQTARSAQRLAGLKDVRPCPGIAGFSCGSLSVRLDPFGSGPGRLSLRVAVSDVASAPRGVLLFLTGGPGEPGVPFVPRLVDRLGPALDGYRLVMFDQRGTGAGALDCPALQRQMGASDLTVPAPPRSARARRPSGRTGGSTPPRIRSPTSRRCGRRSASPGSPWTGSPYGSYVAERFALAHPGEVSRLVLDSVVPSWNVDPLQLVNMRQSAAVLRDVCAAQRCGFDPASDLAAVVRRYHDGPALLDMLVALSVGDPSFPGVPAALHAAAAGHPDALTALMARVRAADAATAGELSQGLHASALCADMPMPWGGPDTPLAARPAALARAVGRLTPAQVWPFDRATAAGNGFIQTCLHWPPSPAPSPASPRAELPRIPVLLLAGGHDLSTPLAGARAQAALAPDGHLFVVPTAGHSVQNRAAGDPAEAELARFLG